MTPNTVMGEDHKISWGFLKKAEFVLEDWVGLRQIKKDGMEGRTFQGGAMKKKQHLELEPGEHFGAGWSACQGGRPRCLWSQEVEWALWTGWRHRDFIDKRLVPEHRGIVPVVRDVQQQRIAGQDPVMGRGMGPGSSRHEKCRGERDAHYWA